MQETKQWGVRGPLSFTRREMDVLRLMCEGESNADIGKALFLGEKTVKSYVAGVMRKLEARNRTHAVVLALRLGIVPLFPTEEEAVP